MWQETLRESPCVGVFFFYIHIGAIPVRGVSIQTMLPLYCRSYINISNLVCKVVTDANVNLNGLALNHLINIDTLLLHRV